MRVCHAEIGSSIEGRPTVKLDQRFQEWDSYFLNVVHKQDLGPYNMLVEVHTHMYAAIPCNNGTKFLLEAGCLCLEPQYAVEGRIPYTHPQQNAVTYIEQNDGVTDFNSVRGMFFKGME